MCLPYLNLTPPPPPLPQVPLPPLDEKKKVIEEVDKDRRFAIDAAIVRTMKSRKVCWRWMDNLWERMDGLWVNCVKLWVNDE